MDVSLKMSASLKGPTLQTWITKKWPNIFMCFFRIWKYGIFVAICSWFHPFLSNCLLMRAFWKKVFKNLFLELGRKMWFSEKRQKLLYFDKALWPNHLTYSKPLGISGKTMSISFIWYPGIWNLSSHWVTVALWKWWPLKGSGRKWVIRPYPLACPWMVPYSTQMRRCVCLCVFVEKAHTKSPALPWPSPCR